MQELAGASRGGIWALIIRKTILCFFLATWSGTFPRVVGVVGMCKAKGLAVWKQYRDVGEVSPVSVSGLSPLR